MSEWRYIGSVGLPEGSIDLRAGLVGSTTLSCFGGLTILEVKSEAERSASLRIRGSLDDDVCLILTEAAAEHIVGPQEIDAAQRMVEVVPIIAIQIEVQRSARQEAGQRANLSSRARRTHLGGSSRNCWLGPLIGDPGRWG